MNKSKKCPECLTSNAFGNSLCFKCGTDIIRVEPEHNWEDKYKDEGPETGYIFSEIFSVTFVVCSFAAIVLAFAGITLMIAGFSLAPVFLVGSVAVGGTPFVTDDPVGLALRERLLALEAKKKKTP